jgi:8-oxo-dGTP diphosphatase
MMNTMNEPCYYRVSVKGLVTDETGRMLLIRESSNYWDIMGGGLDHGEDPIECLRREIQEEMGLIVTSASQAPKYFITAQRPDNGVYIANIIYQIELADLNFTPSEECEELRFCSLADMADMQLQPNVQKLYEILSEV